MGNIKRNMSAERKFERDIRRELLRRLRLCGELLRKGVIKTISVDVKNHGRSLPGDPPHAETGALKKSIFWKIVGDGVIVGSALLYGYWLETGTKNMAARPYLEPTMNKLRALIQRIIRTGSL